MVKMIERNQTAYFYAKLVTILVAAYLVFVFFFAEKSRIFCDLYMLALPSYIIIIIVFFGNDLEMTIFGKSYSNQRIFGLGAVALILLFMAWAYNGCMLYWMTTDTGSAFELFMKHFPEIINPAELKVILILIIARVVIAVRQGTTLQQVLNTCGASEDILFYFLKYNKLYSFEYIFEYILKNETPVKGRENQIYKIETKNYVTSLLIKRRQKR